MATAFPLANTPQFLSVLNILNYITTEVDYGYLTDFFIVYRLFLDPLVLLSSCFERLKGAYIHDQEFLKCVRIFVIIRHWILNYFADDFLPSS